MMHLNTTCRKSTLGIQSDSMRNQAYPNRKCDLPFAFGMCRGLHLPLMIVMTCLAFAGGAHVSAQENDAQKDESLDQGSVRTLVLESRTPPPPPPVFYSAKAIANATVGRQRIDQNVMLETLWRC